MSSSEGPVAGVDVAPGEGMVIEQVLPVREKVDLAEALRRLQSAPVAIPFESSRIDFVADVARRLGRRAKGLPEVQALAYWMRKAELKRLATSFGALGSDQCLLMPRGTVFHVPPANVGTLFAYSWTLSVLVGNRNIVRLSSRSSEQSTVILDTIGEVLGDHPDVAGSSIMVTYGHDDAVTAAISSICDTRVIWGGDKTINRIRAIPISAHTTELTFADRFSMAAIGIDAYALLGSADRDMLAERFFNDAYWFDQLGCSSARLVIWVGEGDPDSMAADFYERVRNKARTKSYVVETSNAIAKLSQAYRTMIDTDVLRYLASDNVLTVLEMSSFPDVRGEFCGGGFFYQLHVSDIAQIVPDVCRADQTLAVFGIPEPQLRDLVVRLRGRGIDRIVPFGQALQFDRFWDGYDLLGELTRKVTITLPDDMGRVC